jgi:hypothetical protein
MEFFPIVIGAKQSLEMKFDINFHHTIERREIRFARLHSDSSL